MNNSIKLFFIFTTIVKLAFGQTNQLTKTEKENSVKKLEQIIRDNYIFPDIAKKISDHLDQCLKKNLFDKVDSSERFALLLTREIQSINHDKHLEVWVNQANPIQENKTDIYSDILENCYNTRRNAGGFAQLKVLRNNIGYFEPIAFSPINSSAPYIDNAMHVLKSCNAIVIDLRRNRGGDPQTVQYLCSYFLSDSILLNTIKYRSKSKMEFWTVKTQGKRLQKTPLFILTSNNTFSAAEEFCYNLQSLKRAIIIGDTTAGGANPGESFKLNERFMVFVPVGQAINPVSGKNWEGQGILPNIPIENSDDSYKKAVDLATNEGRQYRQTEFSKDSLIISKVKEQINKVGENSKSTTTSNDEKYLLDLLKQCLDTELLNEGEINNIAYYLLGDKQATRAEYVFKCNTILFPNSVNAYDSYAEALLTNGKKELSIANYQKAYDLAKAINSSQIKNIEENLKKAQGSK